MSKCQGNRRWAQKILILFVSLSSLLTVSCATNQDKMLVAATNDFAHHRYHLSFDKTRFLAFKGNLHAQYALGYMYYYGIGIVEDHDIGRAWIQMAAVRGYTPAIKAMQLIFAGAVEQEPPFGTTSPPPNRVQPIHAQVKPQQKSKTPFLASRSNKPTTLLAKKTAPKPNPAPITEQPIVLAPETFALPNLFAVPPAPAPQPESNTMTAEEEVATPAPAVKIRTVELPVPEALASFDAQTTLVTTKVSPKSTEKPIVRNWVQPKHMEHLPAADLAQSEQFKRPEPAKVVKPITQQPQIVATSAVNALPVEGIAPKAAENEPLMNAVVTTAISATPKKKIVATKTFSAPAPVKKVIATKAFSAPALTPVKKVVATKTFTAPVPEPVKKVVSIKTFSAPAPVKKVIATKAFSAPVPTPVKKVVATKTFTAPEPIKKVVLIKTFSAPAPVKKVIATKTFSAPVKKVVTVKTFSAPEPVKKVVATKAFSASEPVKSAPTNKKLSAPISAEKIIATSTFSAEPSKQIKTATWQAEPSHPQVTHRTVRF